MRPRVLPQHVVVLFDAWALLAVMWATRAVSGSLDPSVALLGFATFAQLRVFGLGVRQRLSASAVDDAAVIIRRVALSFAVASALTVATGVGDLSLALWAAAGSIPALVAGRWCAYVVGRRVRQRGVKTATLVIGAGVVARRITSILNAREEYGFRVVGAVDDRPKLSPRDLGTRILGGLSDIPELIRRHEVGAVIVAFTSGDQGKVTDLARGVMELGASVWVVPRLFELGATNGASDHLWGLPVVKLRAPARRKVDRLAKRALDCSVSGAALLLLGPVMAFITAALYLTSGRPILHRQVRVGLNGRTFEMLKFRSMRPASETVHATEWSPDADRVTRIGKLLRMTGLDELPQLLNIFRGDMSLVGPRPERPHFVEQFSALYPHYHGRHRFPAGVTGWAQIHGLRGDTSIEERAAFDNYYIENWSLGLDIKILLRTFLSFLNNGER
jgi:exopolysaccharide biosynthesis polyprenyl glycosylphosphotransferase